MRLAARGLPLVIVNPAHVLGAGDPGRSSTTLVRRFMRRQIPAYVDGTLNIVGVQDVARAHLLADERGQVGERYILGNRNFTFDRLFADLGAPVRGRAAGGEAAAAGRARPVGGRAARSRLADAPAGRGPRLVAELGVRQHAGRAASSDGVRGRTRIAWRRRSPGTASSTAPAWRRPARASRCRCG